MDDSSAAANWPWLTAWQAKTLIAFGRTDVPRETLPYTRAWAKWFRDRWGFTPPEPDHRGRVWPLAALHDVLARVEWWRGTGRRSGSRQACPHPPIKASDREFVRRLLRSRKRPAAELHADLQADYQQYHTEKAQRDDALGRATRALCVAGADGSVVAYTEAGKSLIGLDWTPYGPRNCRWQDLRFERRAIERLRQVQEEGMAGPGAPPDLRPTDKDRARIAVEHDRRAERENAERDLVRLGLMRRTWADWGFPNGFDGALTLTMADALRASASGGALELPNAECFGGGTGRPFSATIRELTARTGHDPQRLLEDLLHDIRHWQDRNDILTAAHKARVSEATRDPMTSGMPIWLTLMQAVVWIVSRDAAMVRRAGLGAAADISRRRLDIIASTDRLMSADAAEAALLGVLQQGGMIANAIWVGTGERRDISTADWASVKFNHSRDETAIVTLRLRPGDRNGISDADRWADIRLPSDRCLSLWPAEPEADLVIPAKGSGADFITIIEAVTRIREAVGCGTGTAESRLLRALQSDALTARRCRDGVGAASAADPRVPPADWATARFSVERALRNIESGGPRWGELVIGGEERLLTSVVIEEADFAFWLAEIAAEGKSIPRTASIPAAPATVKIPEAESDPAIVPVDRFTTETFARTRDKLPLLIEWATQEYRGRRLPGRDVILKDHRAKFGKIGDISEPIIRDVREAVADDASKAGGAPAHKVRKAG